MKLINRRHFAALFGAFLTLPAIGAVETVARRIAPVIPVTAGEDPLVMALLKALKSHDAVALYYLGGSTPGALRKFQPIALYRLCPGGVIYAHGRCLLRGEPRTLRLDKARLA